MQLFVWLTKLRKRVSDNTRLHEMHAGKAWRGGLLPNITHTFQSCALFIPKRAGLTNSIFSSCSPLVRGWVSHCSRRTYSKRLFVEPEKALHIAALQLLMCHQGLQLNLQIWYILPPFFSSICVCVSLSMHTVQILVFLCICLTDLLHY